MTTGKYLTIDKIKENLQTTLSLIQLLILHFFVEHCGLLIFFCYLLSPWIPFLLSSLIIFIYMHIIKNTCKNCKGLRHCAQKPSRLLATGKSFDGYARDRLLPTPFGVWGLGTAVLLLLFAFSFLCNNKIIIKFE